MSSGNSLSSAEVSDAASKVAADAKTAAVAVGRGIHDAATSDAAKRAAEATKQGVVTVATGIKDGTVAAVDKAVEVAPIAYEKAKAGAASALDATKAGASYIGSKASQVARSEAVQSAKDTLSSAASSTYETAKSGIQSGAEMGAAKVKELYNAPKGTLAGRTADPCCFLGLAFLCVFCPPLLVLLLKGCGWQLLLNMVLCMLFGVPGFIHALCILFADAPRDAGAGGKQQG